MSFKPLTRSDVYRIRACTREKNGNLKRCLGLGRNSETVTGKGKVFLSWEGMHGLAGFGVVLFLVWRGDTKHLMGVEKRIRKLQGGVSVDWMNLRLDEK